MLPDEEIQKAQILIQVDRAHEATEILSRVLEEWPDHSMALAFMGYAQIRAGNPDEGEEYLAEALSLDPESDVAAAGMFELHKERHQNAAAERVALEQIRRNPRDANWMTRYAGLLLDNLQFDKAGSVIDEALRIDPDNQHAHFLTVLVGTIRGNRTVSEHSLAELIKQNPAAIHTTYSLLVVLLNAGREREALAIAEELVRARPNQPEFVNIVIDLRVRTHWFALPAWPLRRFGWTGAIVIYVVGIGGLQILSSVNSPLTGLWLAVYLIWVVHSWTYVRILTPLVRRGIL